MVPPGARKPTVSSVSFTVGAGSALGIVGPSGSGKSSLARALVGAWGIAGGKVRLDGASLSHWEPEALGQHIGYLPQGIDLFDGTIAENIARFIPDADPAAIVAAAKAAGAHDMILRLEEGYETRVGEAGTSLSAGQRQRIGLARALFGDPFLVVLDEPNANLDAEGEAAVLAAVEGVRARGGIAVVIVHRPGALQAADLVLMMDGGRARAFGPRDEVLAKVARPGGPGVGGKPLRPCPAVFAPRGGRWRRCACCRDGRTMRCARRAFRRSAPRPGARTGRTAMNGDLDALSRSISRHLLTRRARLPRAGDRGRRLGGGDEPDRCHRRERHLRGG